MKLPAELDYYTGFGPMTDAGPYADELRELPGGVGELCEVVHGLLIHRDLAFLYGAKFSPERIDEVHVRPLSQMLENILEMSDDAPLTTARPPEKRMVSTCRDFSVMICAMLRYQGIPARARCGFGAYFNPGRFEDHWVGEYWNAEQRRWVLADAQLDSTISAALKPDFDVLDIPRDRFIIAGDAWQQCRSGKADASKFGLSFINMSGDWFIGGNIIRDLASLNRIEMLPWDIWGGMAQPGSALNNEQTGLFDRVAGLTMGRDRTLDEIRAVYESDERLRVPPLVFNAIRNASEKVPG